ncbi:CDP-glycerol glycerophosphotransferase family protein [Alkalicoccobacillus porphyridii]|uniref:CDP-glycerol glycerophosphotransferase family protein n=1 Tax=Alkalicoccobacillus porphyridii TaxID=2597270 RepID=A0A554A3W7_9BACI|nr:CDP-glycerol glycerophosphotransferase family protein [Alkalicoccobacillus porphyridii]TSB48382.1 CDP-glycerol glycerophosphotransferase family protein [Alkalicoccobacillus porphyridii]
MKALLKQLKQHPFSRQVSRWVFLAAAQLPVQHKLIMFESFSGKQYSCNPRAIYEYLNQHSEGYELIWSINKGQESFFKNAGIPYIRRLSLQWFIKMARAKYWVTNSRMPSWVPKPKHNIYIQTWHGTPLKRLVADMEEVHMPGTDRKSYIEGFHQEAKHWDYLLSPNQYSSEIFKRAFDYSGEIIEKGYPRNDDLINLNHEEEISKLKEQYGLPKSKKVILYAPTWRDNDFYEPGRYKFKLQLDLSMLQKELGSQYVVILRMHSFISESLDISEFEGFVFDYSKGVDITNLYLVSDVLITDYSSVFFDYAILRRPMLFFTYDIELYRGKIRGFYFDLEKEAPGPLVMNTQQIIDEIQKFNDDSNPEQEQKMASFIDRFCYLEKGESAKKTVEAVFGGKE